MTVIQLLTVCPRTRLELKSLLEAGADNETDVIMTGIALNDEVCAPFSTAGHPYRPSKCGRCFSMAVATINMYRSHFSSCFEKTDESFTELSQEQRQEEICNIKNGLNFAKKVLTTPSFGFLMNGLLFCYNSEGN